MISDKEIKKNINECLNDPEHGEMFKSLFAEVLKSEKRNHRRRACDFEWIECRYCGGSYFEIKSSSESDNTISYSIICVGCNKRFELNLIDNREFVE